MRSATFVLPLLACLTSAQPHNRNHVHKHPARHVDQVIEWVTVTKYETEVVPCTTTILVSDGFVPPVAPTSSSSALNVPAQFFQPVSKSPKASPTTTSTSVYVAPAPVYTPPTTSVVPPVPTTSPAEIYYPPVPTTTSQYVAPTSNAAPAPVPSSAPASSSSSGGECSEENACTGDITHYDAAAGIGACGWMSDGATENVLALSHVLMGAQSNGNPFCGKTVTVKLNGKSITAKVVDKCMGCEVHAIDLSDKAFAALADMGIGRTQVEWYFN